MTHADRPRRSVANQRAGLALWAVFLCGSLANGQTDPTDDPVAARVNDVEIRISQVEREMREAIKDLHVDPSAMNRLRLETLGKLIDRQLVLAYLEQRKLVASKDDVDLAWKRLETELKGRDRSIDDYCRQLGLTRDTLRDSLRWSLSWKAHLDRFLTDANIEKYYGNHRRAFDGTELRVAHLLIKVASPENEASAVETAKSIRQRIAAGELAFPDAARQFSQAPTAAQGGELGWIARHQPMPESFNQAAFALDAGEVSEPVVTPFGVHLISCLEVRPGQITWKGARRELEKEMAAYLFSWSADQQRPSARIVQTGALPGGVDR